MTKEQQLFEAIEWIYTCEDNLDYVLDHPEIADEEYDYWNEELTKAKARVRELKKQIA